jgi:hypothetical protein
LEIERFDDAIFGAQARGLAAAGILAHRRQHYYGDQRGARVGLDLAQHLDGF